jgi:hypothetical protein
MGISNTLWQTVFRAFHEAPVDRQRREAKITRNNGAIMGVGGIAIAILARTKAAVGERPIADVVTVFFVGLLTSFFGFKWMRWGIARLEANEFGEKWEFDGIKVVSVSLKESDVIAIRSAVSANDRVHGRLWKICQQSPIQVLVRIRRPDATDDQKFTIQKADAGWKMDDSEKAEE